MDISELIKQLPNFAGLVVCIFSLQWVIKWLIAHIEQQERRIDGLVKTIVSRENCPPDELK
jgi:hypothetical protein